MKITNLRPSLSDRVQFRLSESIRVPEVSGCYALTNIYNNVMYIGQSVNLSQRMQQHLGDPRMTGNTPLGLANWFYYALYPSTEIIAIEDQLLFNFKAAEGQLPTLNRIGP